MKTITLTDLRAQIERKKSAIGWTDNDTATEALRNSGANRTPAKRKFLARIEARAKAANRKPVPSNF